MLKLPIELQLQILSPLCIVDRVAAEWTCKKFQELKPTKIHNRTFFDILREKLGIDLGAKQSTDLDKVQSNLSRRELKDVNGSIFYLMCNKNKVVISGSFILDCLYDTNFHNDINLYRHRAKSNPFDGCDFFGDYMDEISRGVPTEKTFSLSYDNAKHTIATTKKRLDTIIIDSKRNIETVILEYGDIDLTKARYCNGVLKVCSWENLIERKDYTRILSIEQENDSWTPTSNESEIREERKRKYEKRGFRITPHPKTESMQIYLDSGKQYDILEDIIKKRIAFSQFDD